jgi:dTDP-4-amino-4,6-dideoxygalactose transaminase
MQRHMGESPALLTTSGSHALDMAARLSGAGPGDEVILPSYTFPSTANAFVGCGATPVFIDVRPDTMNLDETLIEQAITPKTKAIVPVHYAGVACEMDTILEIAGHRGLAVVEDAAQALMASYKGRPLGSLSDYGCFSFHETKNFSMGEGGALIVHGDDANEKAEILREKGTDRSKFFRGQIDKYSWIDYGSSYVPADMLAAYLWSQLEFADEIIADRMSSWQRYMDGLSDLGQETGKGLVELPQIPPGCAHNAHMFYLKTRDLEERTCLIAHLAQNGISAPYHYVPLHSSAAGRKYGVFRGEDRYTTKDSERLLRLPMYYGLSEEDALFVIGKIRAFYHV